MSDKRGYDLASAISTEDADVFFNVDKAGFTRAKQYKQSVLKGHFKVGDQLYTEENYVTDGETLTVSIDQLDIALKDVSDAVDAITTSTIKSVKLTISTANVALLGTAYELLPALGAYQSYQLIDMKWAISPSSTLDVGGQNLEIYFENQTKYLALIREASLESASTLVKGVQIQAEHELRVNKKLYCKLSGDVNPSSGTAYMYIWVVYQEITTPSTSST